MSDGKFAILKQEGASRWVTPKSATILFGVALLLLVGMLLIIKAETSDRSRAIQYQTASGSTVTVQHFANFDAVKLDGENLTRVTPPVWWNVGLSAKNGVTRGDIISFGMAVLSIFLVYGLGATPMWIQRWLNSRPRRKEESHGVINISEAPDGVIASRVWTYKNDGWLRSAARRTKWPSIHVRADAVPVKKSVSGIYGMLLGNPLKGFFFKTPVAGIIAFTGKMNCARDGMIRAEYCTILTLVAPNEKQAVQLREHYPCPIIVSRSPLQAVNQWMLTTQGAGWLMHNDALISRLSLDGTINGILNRGVPSL